MKKSLFVVMTVLTVAVLAIALTACNKTGTETEGTVNEVTEVEVPSAEIVVPAAEDMFTDRDTNTAYNATPVEITLNGATASCDDDSVSISGGIITITKKGTYEFSGTLTEGQIIIDTPSDDQKKVQIVLNDAHVTCTGSAAIYVKSADKVFVTTYNESSLASVGDFTDTTENNVDGAVYSKDDICFNGTGTLTISASAGNGIVGKDDLKMTSGTYIITASNHGLDANDSIRIKGGSYTINAGKDGIHCENSDDETLGYVYIENGTFNITSANDCIQAASSLQIVDGSYTLVAGGGSDFVASTDSKKGLKATGNLVIYGGTININSADDALHSNGSLQIDGGTMTLSSGDDGVHADGVVLIRGGIVNVTKSYEGIEGKSVTIQNGEISVYAEDDGINSAGGNDQSGMTGRPGQNSFSTDGTVFVTISGGTVYINAAGDGIDSNGNLYVSGGEIIIDGPTNSGNGALDYDGNGQITGGTIIALGSRGMAMNFNAATQGAILINLSVAQSAGSVVKLTDGDGNIVAEYTAKKSYQSVIISSPAIEKGAKYTLSAGNYSATISMTSLIYGGGSQMGGPVRR